jgi:class 3 adenylate cyclase
MAKDLLSDKLAVILHADVAGSTEFVQQDERLAHERIQDSFHRFSDVIEQYRGKVLELRGDALLAEFDRASDAVTATLAFQADQAYYLSRLKDDLKPSIRVDSGSSSWQTQEACVLLLRYTKRCLIECRLILRILVSRS